MDKKKDSMVFPRFLLNEEFRDLSSDAKMLYSLYFDRMVFLDGTFMVDETESLYFDDPYGVAIKYLGTGKNRVDELLLDLEGAGLLKRRETDTGIRFYLRGIPKVPPCGEKDE